MLTAYLTKPNVMDVICGGIDRCTVWLGEPPKYRELQLECPVFGEIIDPNELQPSRWIGEECFQGKLIRKSGGALLDFTWEQILNTYRFRQFDELMIAVDKASSEFKTLNNYPRPPAHTDIHASFLLNDERRRYIHEQVDKEGMRQHEWALKIELGMGFSVKDSFPVNLTQQAS